MVIDSYQALKEFMKNSNSKPKLLIHSCCAPCSSYVLDFLKKVFDITIYFYNPNIYPQAEHDKRLGEFNKLEQFPILVDNEGNEVFYEAVRGLENLPEGSKRCFACYKQRLTKTATKAKANGFDYFTTTLSISPYKNSNKINEIGQELADEIGVNFLYSNFKKEEGYKKSIQLSKEYDLYRQHYCGCVFSLKEAQAKTTNSK